MRLRFAMFCFWSCVLFAGLLIEIAQAQPLPDSLRQPVFVSVVASPELQPRIQQYLELYLIQAEAQLVPQEKAIWKLHVQAAEYDGETSVIALSLVAMQPATASMFGLEEPPDENGSANNSESGDWVKGYMLKESLKQVSMVKQHEVVVVAVNELEAGCADLIRRFQEKQLASIRRRFLQGQE